MKLSALQNSTPPGTEVEFLLAGGAKLRGLVVRIEQDWVEMEIEGRRQNVFFEAICSFSVIGDAESRVPPPAPTPPPEACVENPALWGTALECRDEIKNALSETGDLDADRVVSVAQRLAEEIQHSGRPPGRKVWDVLVGIFKEIEHRRAVLLAGDTPEAPKGICLSRALVTVNRLLRSMPRGKPIDHFVDLYHLYVAIYPHSKAFREDLVFWAECCESLRACVQLGRQILRDPEILGTWERYPHLREAHYRRMSRLCSALVDLNFAPEAEVEQLSEDAERFDRLADANAPAPPPTPASAALGQIVTFGPAPYGYIQSRDHQRLFVHLREILTPELRKAVQSSQSPLDISVDFDVEPPVDRSMAYNRAVRVRPPGSVYGQVDRVDPTRNFGYIKLSDRRTVHFWLNNWPEGEPPRCGMEVLCWPEASPHGRGWTSKYIDLVEPLEVAPSSNSVAYRLLGEATNARDNGDFGHARNLFEKGLRECPVTQIVLSYAAMLKMSGDMEGAARIYERGLQNEEIAKSSKVWEDAGVFAGQCGRIEDAIRYLDKALELARAHPEQRGLKGVLQALGHAHYQRGTEDSLRLADRYYQETIELYGGWESFCARVPARMVNQVEAVQLALSSRYSSRPNLVERNQPSQAEAHQLIEEASRAREEGDFERARELFEKGLRDFPVPQIVLGYAALVKSADPGEATNIYERGLKIPEIAGSSKVWEDAGVFASQRGQFDDAVRYLDQALVLARAHPEQRGLKGVLQALGNAHHRRGTEESILLADRYYKEAIDLYGGWDSFRTRVPSHMVNHVENVQAALARLRSQSNSASSAYAFLEGAGLRMVEMERGDGFTDLLCKVVEPDLLRDYGLAEHVFVRLYLEKSAVSENPQEIEDAAAAAAERWKCDKAVALLIAPSVSKELEQRLRRRLEDTSDRRPLVIVPLAQRDLEPSAKPMQTIRDVLGSFLYRRDLYPRVGIVTGAEFFGRQRVLAEINDLLLRGEPIGLFGLRRTGKTSVLQAVKERQREQGNIVLHADLLGSAEQKFAWLLHLLANDLRNSVAADVLPPDFHWDLGGRFRSVIEAGNFPISDGFFSDLSRVLQALELQPTEMRPKIILVIDELETLQEQSQAQTLDLLRNARSLQNRYRAGFDYIVTAANPSICEAGQIDGRDNPVFNCIRPLYLEFLSFEECSDMIVALGRYMGVSFTPDALRRVYEATAGHPFFTRYLCSVASKLRPSRPVQLTQYDIVNAEGIYKRERSGNDLDEIILRLERDYPAELVILRKLASSLKPVPLRLLLDGKFDQEQRAIRHLLGYQLAAENDHGIVLRMELMRRWLTGYSPEPPRVAPPVVPVNRQSPKPQPKPYPHAKPWQPRPRYGRAGGERRRNPNQP